MFAGRLAAALAQPVGDGLRGLAEVARELRCGAALARRGADAFEQRIESRCFGFRGHAISKYTRAFAVSTAIFGARKVEAGAFSPATKSGNCVQGAFTAPPIRSTVTAACANVLA